MFTAKQLLPLCHHSEIASHIPGRLRLCFSAKIFVHIAIISFCDKRLSVENLPALLSYRCNLSTMSVVFNYDSQMVPYQLINQLFHIEERLVMSALDELLIILGLNS
ncbi:MAG: hypothetical protein GY787_21295 [Alteromonadales bacterium]|nr:hypothetical protein [Alteromonadales bacterium]